MKIRMPKDRRWLIIWLVVTAFVAVWDILFLNKPALLKVVAGFFNTMAIALLAVLFTLALGWVATVLLHSLSRRGHGAGYIVVTFLLNVIRSIPQIVGVLFGYVIVGLLLANGTIRGNFGVFVIMALIISLFIFIEMVDMMRERIAHYQKLDFYSAMLVCGIPERRIINFDILWKNSRLHIFNKLISVFGMAVFLQCSVDFIISVGLSTDVSAVNLPTTLGSLLAKIDSKQDILFIGTALTHPSYIPSIFFEHLQGVTVAFLIVFNLLSIFTISNAYAERNRL